MWVEILSRFRIDSRARTLVGVSYLLVGRSVLSAFNDAAKKGQSDITAAVSILEESNIG